MKTKAQELPRAVDAAIFLTEALPTAGKVEVLRHLLTQLSTTELSGLSSDTRARADLIRTLPEPLAFQAIKSLVTQEGGIFIGKDELVKLRKISPFAKIPELPKAIEAFLRETHPLRGGTIASHVILAFDPKSKEWHGIDRGEGGESDIVPRSLGPKSKGLSGTKQDELLKKNGAQIEVQGAPISSPKDCKPVERILNNAIALHLRAGKPIEDAPFVCIWGRTADTKHARAGCRVLLGLSSDGLGTDVDAACFGLHASYDIGLLASWNLKKLNR